MEAVDTAFQAGGAWSPYLAGALIGVLVCLTLYFSEEPVGVSSFYATVAGFIGMAIAPKHTKQLAYYQENPPVMNWEFSFVLAVILGSAAAAASGGEWSVRGLPQMWTDRYGAGSGLRYAGLSFLGGALMAFGARLSGGCTSGHGISGTAQLSVSSWLAVISFFLGGMIAVRAIY